MREEEKKRFDLESDDLDEYIGEKRAEYEDKKEQRKRERAAKKAQKETQKEAQSSDAAKSDTAIEVHAGADDDNDSDV